MAKYEVVVVSLALLYLFTLSFAQPTTPYIQEVFVGKCYQRNPTGVNCTDLWVAFSAAASMNNWALNDTYYDPFFSVANFSTPVNQILFWSGNQAFAMAIANNGQAFTTIESTSTGYVLNGLSWCGTPANQFDYTNNCLYPRNATYYGTQGVWARASQFFARSATGAITILLQPNRLNYNSGPYMAYRNTSVFYLVELPNINIAQVTSVTILLLANKTLAPGEVCGNGSLATLQTDIQAKFQFAATCIDDPKQIYNILCPNGSVATAECMSATLAYSEAPPVSTATQDAYFVWAIVMTIALAAVSVLTLYFFFRARRTTA